jgi:hypothetical protein
MFSYLQKKTEDNELFVQELAKRLEFAFNRARTLQAIAAKRNKARQPEQYTPKFKPGDFLLLQERAAKEGRLEEKDDEGKSIAILRNLGISTPAPTAWYDGLERERASLR